MGSTIKCPKHWEGKVKTVIKNGNKRYISSYCLSCWIEEKYKIELDKYEEKLKVYKSKIFNIFEIPPKRPNSLEFKKNYKSFATSGKRRVKEYIDELRQEYYRRNTPTDFNVVLKLNGVEFENYIEALFHKQGYSVIKTPASGDGGVDLVISKKINNRMVKTAIQCKRYKSSVGISAIQEVFTGKHVYKCSKAIVITTSVFTAPAIKTAKDLKVDLWDKYKLIEEINRTLSSKSGNTLSWEEYLSEYLLEDVFPS
jgi:hypothetical protein